MKKTAGLSVGAIGFAILVMALDFAVVRAACLSPRSKNGIPWSTPSAGPSGRSAPQPRARRVGRLRLLPAADDQCPLDRRLPLAAARSSHRRDSRVRHRRLGGDLRRLHILPDLSRDGDRHGHADWPPDRLGELPCSGAAVRARGVAVSWPFEMDLRGLGLGMDLRGHLRGPHPDRVFLHPASAGGCHRGAGRPVFRRGRTFPSWAASTGP